MFEFVRRNTKFIAAPLFLLIIAAFVLVGIDGYKGFAASGATVAKVGNASITQEEWDFAHKNQVDRIRAQMPTVDAKLLDSPEAKYASLERLVRERVMDAAADKLHLQTADGRLARELQQNEMIASLRTPDGKLDMDRYRQLVASQGLTPEGFEARVRRDISVRQVEAGITGSAFTAPVADLAINH